MGWLEYRATNYNKDGSINRKKECDEHFECGLNRGFFKVIKSRIVGTTYYGAIMPLKRHVVSDDGEKLKSTDGKYVYETIPENEREVFAVVMLTGVRGPYFSYKLIDETMGPSQCNCPKSILDALTPTDSEYAENWRKRCRDNLRQPSLAKLPIGTDIEFEMCGEVITLRKSAPRYQFKKAFWINDANYTYFSKKRIPSNFKIVSIPKT